MTRAGFVMCGGLSSRMGTDKALLPFHGRTLLEQVAEQVRTAVGAVTLLGPAERYAHLGFPVIPDRQPGCGPLAGILAALESGKGDWNLIVACDMPGVSAPRLVELLRAASVADCDCLLPLGPTGQPEPLCAVYHSRSLPHLRLMFDSGVRKVTTALDGLHVTRHKVEDSLLFENVNTPSDWDTYRP
ncbi:MAG: molybdenum cofactor guanylyltransferase [Bryobacteraceae bacterium]